VIAEIDRQIENIDLGLWLAPQPEPADDRTLSAA
jgi:hypothetical protein